MSKKPRRKHLMGLSIRLEHKIGLIIIDPIYLAVVKWSKCWLAGTKHSSLS